MGINEILQLSRKEQMTEYENVVYIGSGLDVRPLLCVNAKNFHYIDGIPKYCFGVKDSRYTNNRTLAKFKTNLVETFSKIGFELVDTTSQQPNCFLFRNATSTSVFFHYNTLVDSEVSPVVQTLLREMDAILVIGHMPNKSILPYLPEKFTLIGSTHTYYELENFDDCDEEALDCNEEIYNKFLNKVTRFVLLVEHKPEYTCNSLYTRDDKFTLISYDNYGDFVIAARVRKF